MGKQFPIVLIHSDSTAAIAKIENRYYNGKRLQIRHRIKLLERYSTHGL